MSAKYYLVFIGVLFCSGLLSQSSLERLKTLEDSTQKHLNSSPNKARVFVLERIDICKRNKYKKPLALAYMDLSTIHYYNGDLVKSIEGCNNALAILNSVNDPDRKAKVLSNRGSLLTDLKDYDGAVDDFMSAILINKKQKNLKNLSNDYTNLGLLFLEERKFKKAENYFNECLKIDIELKDSIAVAIDYVNIGAVHLEQHSADTARVYFNQSLDIFIEFNEVRGQISTLDHLGQAERVLGNLAKSLYYFETAIELSKSLDAQGMLLSLYGENAKTYSVQENYSAAIEWMNKKLEIAIQLTDTIQMRDAYFELAESYADLIDNKLSVEYFRKYIELNDLISFSETNRLFKIVELREKISNQGQKLEELEHQKVVDELEKKQNELFLVSSIVFLFLVLIILWVIVKVRKQKWSIDKINLQQQLFRSQVNPHFIFNVFNSIQSSLLTKNYKESQVYLRKFARLIRVFLLKSDSQFSSIEEEIELMRLYLEIEAYRTESNMKFEINVDETIDVQNTLIPTFLCQVYLENAVWHGIADVDYPGQIRISIQEKNNSLLLTIDDNGVGINASKKLNDTSKNEHQSKGMEITQKRIASLNRGKKKKYSLVILDKSELEGTETGTRIEIVVPLENRDQ